jgi:AraC-like DNA-binding protein/mannose-6-phosphate isomerase-like protein (cupin superfamily)
MATLRIPRSSGTGEAIGPPAHRPFRYTSQRARGVWQDACAIIEPQINAEGIHFWQFDRHFPIDIVHLIFDERHPIRLNRHDYFELLYGYAGEIAFQVQDRSLRIRPGDLFVMGSSLYHRPVHSGSLRAKAIAVYFRPELIRAGEEANEDVEYLYPFLAQSSGFPHVVPAESGLSGEVLRLMQQAHSELSSDAAESRLIVKTCLKMILALLAKHYASYWKGDEALDRRHRNIERLRPLFDYIDRHYGERISVADAAARLNMSRSHFTRFFRQVTAESFAVFLNRFRIAKGQALLVSTDKSIAEVSREVGFCDQSHFGAVFHKLVQMTPLQYRRARAVLHPGPRRWG